MRMRSVALWCGERGVCVDRAQTQTQAERWTWTFERPANRQSANSRLLDFNSLSASR